MRRGARAALLLAAAALLGFLAGCSGIAATTEDIAAIGPDPAFKNYASYDSFEIADPRWVHSIKGWNWLTCVRFQDHGHMRIYALFLNANKIVDDRMPFRPTIATCRRIFHSSGCKVYWSRCIKLPRSFGSGGHPALAPLFLRRAAGIEDKA